MKKTIAILATDGFEEIELSSPKEALENEGWTTHIISPKGSIIKCWASTDWGKEYTVDKNLSDVKVADYDALLLPGGVINPDSLRLVDEALSFVKDFFEANKPVAAICHGPQTLINVKVIEGRKMTSFPSIKQDLINAGAKWEDSEVVEDNGLITSRNPDDLLAFNKKIIKVLKNQK